VEKVLTLGRIAEMPAEWADVRDYFFLGRSGDFPVAMEGALKLKEIAYVRAEGYAAGEMKHGPIALIEPGVVVVGVATDTHVRTKTLSNMEEMRARGATIVLVAEEGRTRSTEVADHVIGCPGARPDLHGDGGGAPAAAGLSRRHRQGTRRRQAPQPGQDGDGGVGGEH
jgi:glutamine---fructose-6-phosphate transaminase (isomerizing)